jgi:hypothetical protein
LAFYLLESLKEDFSMAFGVNRSKIQTYCLVAGIVLRAYGTAGLLALGFGATSLLLSVAADDANNGVNRSVASIIAAGPSALP